MKVKPNYQGFLVASLAFVAYLMLVMLSPITSTVQATNNNVCPEGNGWSNHDNSSPFTYTAPAGYIVDKVCIKGGSSHSSNGYLKTFTTNSWYQVWSNGWKNCVGASGIGTATANALQGNASGSSCAAISHASFHIVPVATPTPTVTPTSTPSPTYTPYPTATPTPTPTVIPTPTPTPSPTYTPYPTATPTPTPTVTPTPTPTPTETTLPTPTPTPTVSPEPSPTVVPSTTPVPTQTPNPTTTPTTSTESPKKTALEISGPTCEDPSIQAKLYITENGNPKGNIEVTFTYNGITGKAWTDNQGYARVSFPYTGEGSVKAEPGDGYPSQSTHVPAMNCPNGTGGVVLGTTSGQVLGDATFELAATGTFAQTVDTALRAIVGFVTGIGTSAVMMLKKRK